MIRFHAHNRMQTAKGLRDLDVSFTLPQGQLLAVYGPSGAGKTTLLRILAGLTGAETGLIECDGKIWYDSANGFHLPPQARSVGMVFQDFGLFPHMTVRENLTFASPKGEDTKQIDVLLEQIDLALLQHQKPGRLSGGQRQRVAMARALARRPQLLLLDEPFSAQDAAQRGRLQAYLQQVHRERGLTTVLVTHHLPDVLRLADNVLVLEDGKQVKQGAPTALFPNGTEE